MRRVSPEERAAESVPVRVGLRSSERAPLARLPRLEPTLSEMRVMEPRDGAAESIVMVSASAGDVLSTELVALP